MRRFSFDNIPEIGQQFHIPENKHITKVLRMQEGDIIEATDGTGWISTLELISITDIIIFTVLDKKQSREIPLLSTAYIGEIKAIDEGISLLAEHGIQRIIPFFSERCISKYNAKQGTSKQERRQKIADEAIKKVGGVFSCTVEEGIPFKNLESSLQQFSQKILFWENEHSHSQHIESINFQQEHCFIIGPEGGFSSKEVDTLTKWGCQSYSLGTRILRAQNAAATAATLFRYLTEKSSQ